jgi:hypothetical protein
MKKTAFIVITVCLGTSAFASSKMPNKKHFPPERFPSSFSLFAGNPDAESGSSFEMMEEEEYDGPLNSEEEDETEMDDQERMEERSDMSSSVLKSEQAIDYTDRTRTNRERKALNTSSHASDDE